MQTAQIDNSFEFARHAQEPTFSSVWGNEMQREDFLALASGLRQHNASLSEVEYTGDEFASSTELHARIE